MYGVIVGITVINYFCIISNISTYLTSINNHIMQLLLNNRNLCVFITLLLA